jgi:hypothetical protein
MEKEAGMVVVGKLVIPTNNGNEGKSYILYNVPTILPQKSSFLGYPYLHKFAYIFVS